MGGIQSSNRNILTSNVFIIGFSALFGCLYYTAWLAFKAKFPSTYAWSELMIGYQGGYMRRGLLGQTAFYLDPKLPAVTFLSMFVAITYAIVILFYVERCSRLNFYIGLVFMLSPSALMFPILDRVAFGRKDGIILVLFIVSFWIFRVTGRLSAILLTTLLYVFGNFIVETSLFYYPLAIFNGILLHSKKPDRRMILECIVLPMIFVFLFSAINLRLNTIYLGQHAAEHQKMVADAWQARYPGSFGANSAIEYIGMSTNEAMSLVAMAVGNVTTFFTYLACFLLSIIPSLLLGARFRWNAFDKKLLLVGLAASAWAFGPFVLAADWGRYIHLFSMHIFVVAASFPLRAGPILQKAWQKSLAIAVIIVYASSWRMEHFVGAGISAINPGIAFRGY